MRKLFLLLLIAAIPAFGQTCTNTAVGAYTCVHASTANGTTSSTGTLNGHTINNLLIIGCTVNDTAASAPITPSNSLAGGYTWSVAFAQTRLGTTKWIGLWYAVAPTTTVSNDTMKCTDATATFTNIATAEWKGTGLTPLDGVGATAQAASGTAPASGNYTVTTGDLNIGFAVGASAIAAGSGWNSRAHASGGFTQLEDQVAASGTANAIFSQLTSAWCAIGVAFKGAPANVQRRGASTF